MRSRRRSLVPAVLLALAILAPIQLQMAGAATDPHTPIGTTPFQEGSGVVASRQHANVHWAHVDSGSPETYNKLWAFHVSNGALGTFPSGAKFKEFTVPGTLNRDWEDIATDNNGNLWIADIGNNSCTRSNLVVHKVREPDPYTSSNTVDVVASYPIDWPAGNYGDGCTGPDAESIFIHGGKLYFVTKTSPTPMLFKMTTYNTGSKNVLSKVANLTGTSDPGEIGRPTGADLSRDGKRLVLTTPGYKAFVYKTSNTSLSGDALLEDLVSRPPAHRIKYRTDSNWEAVEGGAFTDGYDALLLSESGRLLYFPDSFYSGTSTSTSTTGTTQPTTDSTYTSSGSTSTSRLGWLPARGKGVLTGFTVTGRDYNTELAKVRAGAPGYKPAVSREFFKWGTAPSEFVKRANARAAVGVDRIIVNISGSGTDFSDISSGKHDTWIRSVAKALQAAKRPVVLLWFHEPHAHVTESPHVPAGTSYADAARAYISAYRRIISQWRSVNSMTTYVYQSTEYRLSKGDGPDCYPGDSYIDLIGYTGANGYTAQNPWKSPKERLDQARAFIRSTGKRAMVLAGGSAEDPNNPGDRKAGFYDGITYAMKSEPAMALYVNVSTTFTDTGSVQWVDTTRKALSAWQTVVQRPFHNRGGSLSSTSRPRVTLRRVAPAKYGQDLRLRGTLYRDSSGRTLGGKTVRLQMREARRDGSWTSWARAGSKTTNTDGRYRFTRTARRNVRFRVVFSGTSTLSPARSRARSVAVSRRIGARLNDDRVARGARVRLSGRVAPAADGKTIYLQRRRAGGSWDTINHKRVSSRSTYRFRTTARRSGEFYYRAVMRSSALYAGSRSPARALTVR